MTGDITCGGRKPVNPIGSCFDSAAQCILQISDAKMCHGIGVSNMPGQPQDFIAHAWLEAFDKDEGEMIALDTTWMIAQPARIYRKNLKLGYVVEYSREEFIKRWAESGPPGPWDLKIMALTKEGKAAACVTSKS